MAIANKAAYADRIVGPREKVRYAKGGLTLVAGKTQSLWTATGVPAAGVAPTTAAVPTRATVGALGQQNGTNQRILRIITAWIPSGGMLTIADRLSHQGGLSGTVITAQATNLPTAALTRQTTGVGVMAGLEIYTAIGTTATTVTASYTNTVPGAGQVTPATTFGGAATTFGVAGRLVVLPLAQGDRGVTAVASVTVLATTATAGNFGVTLFYPLISVPILNMGDIWAGQGTDSHGETAEALYEFGTWFPKVDTDACLYFIAHSQGTIATMVGGAEVHFAED